VCVEGRATLECACPTWCTSVCVCMYVCVCVCLCVCVCVCVCPRGVRAGCRWCGQHYSVAERRGVYRCLWKGWLGGVACCTLQR